MLIAKRDDYKYCTRCGEYKEVACFAKDRRSADGLQSWCNECKRAGRVVAKHHSRPQLMRSHAMENGEFLGVYAQKWLHDYIASLAKAKTRDTDLQLDLAQEAWVRISFTPRGYNDEALKLAARRGVNQAYQKAWREKQRDLQYIERMSRDEYAMWMTGVYLV